jgi:microcin C transport system permease protein
MNNNLSESIFQKRIKRFKSIKRGYYSLIAIISLYILSLIAPLWINDKPLMIRYANNQYDSNEKFEDINNNGVWDLGEPFNDKVKYFFPAIWDLLDFIPGISYPIYESKYFNQITNKFEVDFRVLDELCEKENIGNYVIMPLYPYHPHEDLKDELDEIYEDLNNNGEYDIGEPFTDENNDEVWTQNNPPTKPDGFGGRHLLGTDNTGRDVFARVIDGFKVSITFAVICTFLSYSIGIIIGGMLGYFGGKVDLFGVRIMEIFSALPFLFIVMILSGFMQPNLFILASILVFLSGWIGISYYIRGEFYREKAKDYVSAAVSMGASNNSVMFKHILPNALTPVITYAPFAIIGYISTLNMLDLLGYGLQPPAASWGEILKQALENLDNWHMLVFPIIAMTITLFMITFIGEAIREAFDPKVYSRLR